MDSVYVEAVSDDGGKSFAIKSVSSDVDGNGDVDGEDKAKLLALAKAYATILNP